VVRHFPGLTTGPWGQKYPAIGQGWRRAWSEVIPFYSFPGEVRRILYTTNAIEALNSKPRRAVRARGHFPTDEAALKLLYLVLNQAEKEWTMPAREWCLAKAQFAVLFGEQFTKAAAKMSIRRLPHEIHDSPGDPTQGQRRLRGGDGGCAGGLYPVA